jgi:hypothetical protein
MRFLLPTSRMIRRLAKNGTASVSSSALRNAGKKVSAWRRRGFALTIRPSTKPQGGISAPTRRQHVGSAGNPARRSGRRRASWPPFGGAAGASMAPSPRAALRAACLRAFGSVAAACVTAGVAGPPCERWSRERIIAELQGLGAGGAAVTDRRTGARLAQACRNRFGSLGAACAATEVRHAAPEPWTRARVLAELERLGVGGRRVLYADLSHSLRRHMARFFGGFARRVASPAFGRDGRAATGSGLGLGSGSGSGSGVRV